MSWPSWLIRIVVLLSDAKALDLSLLILKYVGSIFAAVYGIYATLTDFHKEEQDRQVLTWKGYLGLALLILSSFLSISSDGFKDFRELRQKAEKDKLEEQNRKQLSGQLTEQLKKTNEIARELAEQQEKVTVAVGELEANTRTSKTILRETGRVLQPIKSLTFYFKVAIPSDTLGVRNYTARVDRELADLAKGKEIPDLSRLHVDLSEAVGHDSSYRLTKVFIKPGSPLLPDRAKEPVAFWMTSYLEMNVGFFKQSKLSNQKGSFPPDLEIEIDTELESKPISHELEYDLEKHQLYIACFDAAIDPAHWRNNGGIVSVPDLLNSYVRLKFFGKVRDDDNQTSWELFGIAHRSTIALFAVGTWDGQIYEADAPKLKQVGKKGALDSPAFGGQFSEVFHLTKSAIH